MEEIKNEVQEPKKCCGLNGKCGGKCHKIVRIVLAVFIVFLLLSIGAAIGSRHSERSNRGFNHRGNFGCGMQGNWQGGVERADSQFQMMRGGRNFEVQSQIQDGQLIQSVNGQVIYKGQIDNVQGNTQVNAQAKPLGTSTPATPIK